MRALRHILAGLAGIVAMIAFAGSASADLILLIDDDANGSFEAVVIDDSAAGVTDGSWTSTIADGLGGIDGAVLFAGSIGSWELVVSTGQSKPLLAPSEMDLTLTATSDSADTLSVWLIDTGFLTGGSAVLLEWALDAAAGGTSTSFGCVDPTNSDLGAACTGFVGVGPVGDGFYTDFANVALAAGVPFSMLLNWVVFHTQAGSTTGDLRLTIPEPMTAALFGMGLLGIGAVRRRRKKAA